MATSPETWPAREITARAIRAPRALQPTTHVLGHTTCTVSCHGESRGPALGHGGTTLRVAGEAVTVDLLPDKPAGSVIKECADPAGVTLSWPNSWTGPDRYAVAAFIAFWLCLWGGGGAAAARQLANAGSQPFLVFWL